MTKPVPSKLHYSDPWVQAFLSPKVIEKFREILSREENDGTRMC